MIAVKVAVIVHVYYPGLWQELAGCIANIDEPFDLFVTCADGCVAAAVKREFPHANVMTVENVGFDIWPFLKVLNAIDLSSYSSIVKLHTKRDVPSEPRIVIGGMDCTGAAWRNELLSFIATPDAWAASKRMISRPDVAAVAGCRCIVRRNDVPKCVRYVFDQALQAVHDMGLKPRRPQFVGGTMFLMRAAMLRPLQGRWDASSFDVPAGHKSNTFAHLVERMIGFCACTNGMRITDPYDNLGSYRRCRMIGDLAAAVRRFFFQVKVKDGICTVKIMKIAVRSYKTKPAGEIR